MCSSDLMYPFHIACRLMGVSNLVQGSSGNKGTEAARLMAQYVRAGDSTYFNPDGPDGPPGKVSKGALHVSMQSGVPIMPMAVKTSPCVTFKGWDKKQIPLPFGKIVITYGEALFPDAERLDEDAAELARRMTELSESASRQC